MLNSVCLFVLVIVSRDVSASLSEDMAETTQLCCTKGTSYARNHSSEDCSSSIPPDVPPQFGSLCLFAMDQCCKEYFLKKQDCDSGVETATVEKKPFGFDERATCSATKGFNQKCCMECVKGMAQAYLSSSCEERARGNTAEELLSQDAFTQCCKTSQSSESTGNSTTETPRQATKSTPVYQKYGKSDVTSLCEEYAPNELCAHHCIPVPGSFKCECNPGFMLMADRRNCKEVVKSRCKPRNYCQHKCNDNGVEVKCSCRRGFRLMDDERSCKDINECLLSPSVCPLDTKCQNTPGSYKCIPVKKEKSKDTGQCPPGFARNIVINACDDINECELPHPPCPEYLCKNTIGGYRCDGKPGDPANLPSTRQQAAVAEDRCPPGFRSGVDEECDDVDECAAHKDDCNHISQFCINTRGSFYCQDKASKHCPPGFKIDMHTNKCEDINECDEDDVCRSDQTCVNLPGQYDCRTKTEKSRNSKKCPEGFRTRHGSNACEDIDECIEGTHLCDAYQSCVNTNGSHECPCKLGFELDVTTGACTDVNECARKTDECLEDSQRCDNTVGSYFCVRIVSCGTGYILHHSSGQCEDIDECALGTHNCALAGPGYKCQNVQGSFHCLRQQRTTTSTTTPDPEYEYEYYDSEEEIDTNNTSKPASQDGISSTEKPTSPNEAERPKPTVSSPEVVSPIPDAVPTQPIPTNDVNTEDTRKKPNEDQSVSSPQTSENKLPLPKPTQAEDKVSIYPYDNKQSRQDNKSPVESKVPEVTNESVEPAPLPPSSTEPQIRRTQENSSPKVVLVNPSQETATVKAVKTTDGAVVVQTGDVPKNAWTKITLKPTNCQVGFQMDEYGACYDIDECSTNKHSCSGLTELCRNTMGGYLCDCAPGFRRDLTSGVCDLITTSSSTTTTQAPTTSSTLPSTPSTTPTTEKSVEPKYFWGYPESRTVKSRPFRARNMCDTGFHFNTKTGICEDIDECTNGQANCAAVEICTNTEGGYRCECPPNWQLDDIRHRCVPIRSQGQFPPGYKNQPVYHQTKPDTSVSYETKGTQYVDPSVTDLGNRGSVMKCPWGYRLEDDNTCTDIDECSTGEAKCGPNQICTNLPGGYTCSCLPGHKLVGDHECEDVDECKATGSVPICSQNSDCINTIGSYQCRCHQGFRPAPANDRVCMDVDECTESRAGSLCQQRCNNVWGGYRCSCHRGYRLNADNSTCADVDECTEFKSKVVCVGRCHNEPGSYRCSCPQGYRLSEDNRSCIDINECETGEAPCANGGVYGGTSDVCVNTRGSYRCHRITCPPGYKLEGNHRCTKIDTVCAPSDWKCAHQPSTYSYNYITFVSKLYIPESKVDLFTMKGPSWPYAKMKFELRLLNVNAPPTVKDRADINAFILLQTGNQAVVSLVKPLEGPQSLELELSMELHNYEQFGGIAVARLFIHVSEYEY